MYKRTRIKLAYGAAKEKLIVLRSVGKVLLHSKFEIQKPFNSVWPLGLALLEGFNLFSVLLSGSYEKIHYLFDGGQDKGPNIDTRLRFIRDLFSSCNYSIYYTRVLLAKRRGRKGLPKIFTEGINWLEIIGPHIGQHEEDALVEFSRLINETLEGLLSIGLMLNVSNLNLLSKEIWQEVHRHVIHIRDHYDYAEGYAIDLLRPAEE